MTLSWLKEGAPTQVYPNHLTILKVRCYVISRILVAYHKSRSQCKSII